MLNETKILPNVSSAGLKALADAVLAPKMHAKLDDLLARNSDCTLAAEELEQLDAIIKQIDELTLLKARGEFERCSEAAVPTAKTAESLTVVTFEVEHIIPVSRHGQSSFENLCLACPACNRFKSDRIYGKLVDGTEVPLFNPQQDN